MPRQIPTDTLHMSQKFVVSHLDQQLGPFDEIELKAKWIKGDLLPIDYVYDESKQDWILMSERFLWASAKVEVTAPPPVAEPAKAKKLPPEPPRTTTPPVSVQPTMSLGQPIANPVPPAAKSATIEAKRPSYPEASVKMVDGRGEIDLSPLEPGRIELVLHQSSMPKIPLQNSLKIHVKPSEPHKVEWVVPLNQTVGEDAEVQIRVLDTEGRVCSHYDDHFVVRIQGPSSHDIPVKVLGGNAQIALKQTKTESWKVSLVYPGNRQLQLPDDKSLDWLPGPASKLILNGPPEYVAGLPIKVQVQAVDQYGNLARTFQGTVVLEVKAS